MRRLILLQSDAESTRGLFVFFIFTVPSLKEEAGVWREGKGRSNSGPAHKRTSPPRLHPQVTRKERVALAPQQHAFRGGKHPGGRRVNGLGGGGKEKKRAGPGE